MSILFFLLCLTCAEGSERSYGYTGLKQKVLTYLQNPEARVSLCYILEKSLWTEFSLPWETDRVKILTNANVSKKAVVDPEIPMNYVLEFQLLDRENKIIKSGLYHQYTQITTYGDPAKGEEYTAGYYFNEPMVPGDGRVVVLDFKGIPDTRNLKMRFRISNHDAIVSDVVMRLYYPDKTTESKLDHTWKRTGREKKAHLSRSNLYPVEFLTETEQINLIRETWRPLAPRGSEGKDYFIRKLYVLKEIEDTSVQPEALTKGALLDEHLRLTMPIAQEDTGLRFMFFKEDVTQKDTPPLIKLKWFGKGQQTLGWHIPWDGDQTIYQKRVSPGIIELSCDQAVNVLIYALDTDQETLPGQKSDITPVPLGVRSYEMDVAHPITYKISHARGFKTPFRAGFRKKMDSWHPSREIIHYTFLDKDKNEIRKESCTINFTPSFYDRSLDKGIKKVLSDPAYLYFRISPRVSYIRFSSSTPLLVNAYNRSPRMVKLTRVPEDYQPSTPGDDDKQITWFPVGPLMSHALKAPGRSVLSALQPRPPERDPDLFSGNFKWESFEPEITGRGHYLLVPSEKKSYQRDEALVSNFKELPVNHSVTVDFKSPGNLKVMRPRLVFYNKDKSHPFSIKITMDGNNYYEENLMGATGLLTLPPVTAGKHRLILKSSAKIKSFVNLIRSDDAGHHLRFAHALTEKGLVLDYTKVSPEDETLSMALFFPGIHPERLQLTVEIEAYTSTDQGPFKHITLLKRRYSVRSDNNGPVYLCNTSTAVLGSWQQCFFPVRSDLPPGKYKVKIVLESGQQGYVLPYRVTPGTYSQRKLFREVKL